MALLTLVQSEATAQRRDSLFVFVGAMLNLEKFELEVPDGVVVMDECFMTTFEIIEAVYGTFTSDTITFEVFDHYGIPPFAKYNRCLMYVSLRKDGSWCNEKYQYTPVFKTVDNKWAATYQEIDYSNPYNANTPIKPEPIEFPDSIWFGVKGLSAEKEEEYFPSAYFNKVGDKHYPIMGNYVQELFELKKSGVLKARGIFD